MRLATPVVAVLLLVTAVSPPMATAQVELECEAIQETELCIEDFSVPDGKVKEGEVVELSLTVRNVGNATGDGAVILGVKQPEGGFDYHLADEVANVEPGESKEVTLPIHFSPGNRSGVHEINVMLFDDSQEHLYDATGFYNKINVVEDPESGFDIVGWFENLGIVAHAILTIIALLIFLATGRFVYG